MERLKQFREPAAGVVLAVVAINIVLGVVRVVLNSFQAGVPDAMRAEGGMFVGLVSLLFIAAGVAACTLVAPITRHARLIARIGTAEVFLAIVLAFVYLVGAQFKPSPDRGIGTLLEVLGGLTDITLKGVVGYLLLEMTRRLPATAGAAEPAPEAELKPAPAPVEPDVTQPTTPPAQAHGGGWRTAGEAARGGQGWDGARGGTEGPAAKASPDLWKRS